MDSLVYEYIVGMSGLVFTVSERMVRQSLEREAEER